MKKRFSIRSDLIGFCVAIVLLSMICQIVFNLFFARSLAIYQKEDEIEALFTTISEHYSDDPDVLYQLVASAENDSNITVHILSGDQIIYSSAPYDHDGKTPMISNPDRINMIQGIPPTAETDLSIVRLEESFYYGDEIRTVLIWSSVVAIESSVELFTISNIMVSFGVLILSVLGVIIFSKRFTKPIIDMDLVAKNMANLHFDQQADESVHPAELNSLAISINRMSNRLSSLIDQLETDNASLSSKVEYQAQLEQMRRQFIANISHEMKTPLSMLMMYSESLKADIPGIDRDYYYETIIQEAAGLNAMVEQMLDISSIENGLIQLSPTTMNFSEFVDDILGRMDLLLTPFTLSKQVEPQLFVEGDGKYLNQAISNFLTNAIAHTPEGAHISVSLTQRDGQALFSVTNCGAPIPEEDIPYIWDSFYRGDKSRTTKNQKRVGLGLYIVKTCVDAHQGQVYAENGDGTVSFSFSIPLKNQ